jgi:gamma-glutamyl-gamma-aminobutyrate hydrolase PuuD
MAEDNDNRETGGPPRVPDRRATGGASQYLRHGDTPLALAGRVLRSRWRAIQDRLGRDFMRRTLRIGVSARIYHPEPGASGLFSKNLQYLEESIAQWVMSRDVLVFMVPTVNTSGHFHPSNITLRHYARHLDGLVLQGGADVSPMTYGETAARPEWGGDRARDVYELELLHEFVDAGKPVLGICRGCQLLNVAFGGTLYQDVATNLPGSQPHVHEDYDAHRHAIAFLAGQDVPEPEAPGRELDPPPGRQGPGPRHPRRGDLRTGRHRRSDPLPARALRDGAAVASGIPPGEGHRAARLHAGAG